MKLPFRYQFILAPLTTVAVLAALVAYTLFELANINRENATSREWEVLTDRIQTGIVAIKHLEQVISELSNEHDTIENIEQNEHFFSYLEQSRLVTDNLYDPVLLERVDKKLKFMLTESKHFLLKPETSSPLDIQRLASNLRPLLEHQYKIFVAHRRSAFIDNHRQLVSISSRMTTLLLAGLIFCIGLAVGLAFWGVHKTRLRLNRLSRHAHDVCSGELAVLPGPDQIADELDDLEQCLSEMTQKLLHVISVENVLHGVEKERRRIAMDMHDGALADLTAINRAMDGLDETIGQKKVKDLRLQIDEIIVALRQTIDDLHPQVLETLGLESALQSYFEKQQTTKSFPEWHFTFQSEIESALTQQQKLNLFRILTEVIHNAIKHAQADRLEISLLLVNNKIVCTVEDNGIGIPESARLKGHGCGNILERAHLIGAKCEWRHSRFSTGTGFHITLAVNA